MLHKPPGAKVQQPLHVLRVPLPRTNRISRSRAYTLSAQSSHEHARHVSYAPGRNEATSLEIGGNDTSARAYVEVLACTAVAASCIASITRWFLVFSWSEASPCLAHVLALLSACVHHSAGQPATIHHQNHCAHTHTALQSSSSLLQHHLCSHRFLPLHTPHSRTPSRRLSYKE